VAIGGGSSGSTTLTVTAGEAAKTQVSVSAAAGFSGTVDFSCTGLPMYAACSFEPASWWSQALRRHSHGSESAVPTAIRFLC
jgi:hypothetical protein